MDSKLDESDNQIKKRKIEQKNALLFSRTFCEFAAKRPYAH